MAWFFLLQFLPCTSTSYKKKVTQKVQAFKKQLLHKQIQAFKIIIATQTLS